MIKKIMNFFKKEEGAGLAEYALLLVLIAIVCIATLGPMGERIAQVFTDIVTALNAV